MMRNMFASDPLPATSFQSKLEQIMSFAKKKMH